jgi:very-short-patch-repair endonuclease
MALAGLAASQAAAATRFADYRLRRAAQTLRRQDADLALFARYLAATGAITPTLTPDPSPKGRWENPPSPLGGGAGGEGDTRYKTALPPALLARCRELRKTATDAEVLLWQFLRNRRLEGARFRRQHPYKGYILDFYCHAAKLAIEVDGSGHLEAEQARHDEERTRSLARHGIRVLRFWNHEVLMKTEKVL